MPRFRRGCWLALSATALVLLATAGPAGASGTPAPNTPPAGDYQNPITPLDAPDPTIVSSGGEYYAFATAGLFGPIQTFESADLAHWSLLPSALTAEPAWAFPGQEWAPSVTDFGGTWVMYYGTFDIATETHCISVATSSAVAGPYTDDSSGPLVCLPGDGGTLDPGVFTDANGLSYLVFKTMSGPLSPTSALWVQPLAPGGLGPAPGTGPTLLLTQDEQWESTIENPQMLAVDGTYYLFYSGGYWGDASYAVGYAVCQGPLGPCTRPLDHPILASAGAVVGPGGEWAFQDASGQWWMAYAAWTAGDVGYPSGDRALRMDPLCFVTASGGGPADPVVLGPTTVPGSLQPTCPSQEPGDSYRLAAADGGLFTYGDAAFDGSVAGQRLAGPIVGVATDPATGGYWEVGAEGNVYAFGAPSFGDLFGRPPARPVVGMAATADGGGYWLVGADGGVFAYGDAGFHGSAGAIRLASPVVGMAPSADGGGYWLVAADGGVFAYGDATFLGSMGGHHLVAPVVGMAAMPDGAGYWLVAADGGIFAFGDAHFDGSTGALRLNAPIVGMVRDGAGAGYWLVAADGGVFSFGAASFVGSAGALRLDQPVVAITSG